MFEKLVLLLDIHRKEAHITCAETCLCWQVEQLIISTEESAVEQALALDAAPLIPKAADSEIQPLPAPVVYLKRRK